MKKKNKTKSKLIYLYYAIIILLFAIGITFSKYITTVSSETQIKASKFSFKVGQTAENVEIDLKGTVTNGKEIIPGSEGKIELEIDFSEMEVATNYTITVDTANIPENIKLYTDSSFDSEFSNYSDTTELDTTTVTKTLYWKWNFTEQDETSDWMGKDIKLVLKINVEQRDA